MPSCAPITHAKQPTAAAVAAAGIAKKATKPLSKTALQQVARAKQREAQQEAAEKVLAPWSWTCQCPHYEYRGQFQTPPHCKHILGVAQTLAGDHAALVRCDYWPNFVNTDGPVGYDCPIVGTEHNIVQPCRAWDVKASTAADTEAYRVVRFEQNVEHPD